MKDFYSAQELADLNLPGLPTTERAIQIMAKRDGWIVQDRFNRWQPSTDEIGTPHARKRQGRGGGWEYHYRLLPKAAFDKLINSDLENAVTTGKTALAIQDAFKKAPDTLSQLNDWQREAMEARAAILGWIEEQMLKSSKETAINNLIRMSKADMLPEALKSLLIKANAKSGRLSANPKATVSKRTIKNWFSYRRAHGVKGLAPELTRETDFTIPNWGWIFLDLYRRPNKPSLTAVIEDLPKHLPPEIQVPSYDQAKRFLKKLSPVTLNNGRMGPQALKSMKAFTRRGTEDLWPTAVYSADGHTFKAKVEHPFHGQPFAPEVTIVIDIYTRYVTGWSVALAENSIGVLEALSVSIVEHEDGRHRGLPAIWYTDNGSGFRAKIFEAAGNGFYDRWGITPKKSLPYNSQARGVIERLNKTLWPPLAKRFETYQGKDADKEAMREVRRITDKELRAKKKAPFNVTWDEFKQQVQDHIDTYNNRPHSSLPRFRDPETLRYRHLSPKGMWDKWLDEGGQNRLIAKAEAADLIRPYQRRTTKRGEVRIHNNVYFSFDLEQWHGEEVLVGFNIYDASKVWVRNFDGVLLAVAELDANKRQYFSNGTLYGALSYQDKVLENRTKTRLKLKDKQRAEIIEEAKGAPLEVEYQAEEEMPILTLEAQERAEAELAKMNKAAEPVKVTSPTGRPIFSDDVGWGKWLSDNPTRATDTDVEELQRKLKNDIFRMQMEFEGVPLDTLKEIAANRAAV